jgi:hypothetical protein
VSTEAPESLGVALDGTVEGVGVIDAGGGGHAPLELTKVAVDGGEFVVGGENLRDDSAGTKLLTAEYDGVVLRGEELEENRLAGAVEADEANDFSALNLESHDRKNHVGGMVLGHIGHAEREAVRLRSASWTREFSPIRVDELSVVCITQVMNA